MDATDIIPSPVRDQDTDTASARTAVSCVPSPAAHSVVLTPNLDNAIIRWHKKNHGDKPLRRAVELLIRQGVKQPHTVKAALSRRHIGYVDMSRAVHRSFILDDDVWEMVEAHERKYGLPSASEALRELLRMALGLPPPRRTAAKATPTLRTPETMRRVAFILENCDKMKQVDIAKTLNVSKQYVNQVVRGGASAA